MTDSPTPAPSATLAAPPANPTPGESLYQPIPPRTDAVDPMAAPPVVVDSAKPAEPAAPAEPAIKPDTPATTELSFKLPDGFEADPGLLTSFTDLAKEAGLTQEAGQKLVDLYTSQQKAAADAQTAQWETTQKQWHDQILADPILGGSNADRTQEVLGKALDSYGNQAARDAFSLTGAGNNPDVVRFIYKMAEALNEGTAVAPRGPASAPRTRGQILYGDNPTQ